MGFELKTYVVMSIDCISSCKSNYHMMITMMTTIDNRQLDKGGGAYLLLVILLTNFLLITNCISILTKLVHICIKDTKLCSDFFFVCEKLSELFCT